MRAPWFALIDVVQLLSQVTVVQKFSGLNPKQNRLVYCRSRRSFFEDKGGGLGAGGGRRR